MYHFAQTFIYNSVVGSAHDRWAAVSLRVPSIVSDSRSPPRSLVPLSMYLGRFFYYYFYTFVRSTSRYVRIYQESILDFDTSVV